MSAWLRTHTYDLWVLGGAAAVAAGAGAIYWPAGIIVGGCAAVAWGVLGSATEAATRRRARP